jgi:hypothetical protein
MPATARTSASRPEARYRTNTFLGWFGRIFVLLEIAFGTLLLATAHNADGTQAWILATGGVLLVFGLATLGLALPSWRTTKITSTDLLVPSGLRSWKSIPLSTVTGAGMLFHPAIRGSRTPMMWVTCIWAEGLGRVPIRSLTYTPLLTHATPGRATRQRVSLTTNPWDVDPFGVTDVGLVGHSTAGKATADIYQRAVAYQGSQGRLLTQHMEKHGTYSVWDVPLYTAFWSPDGESARLGRRDPPTRGSDDDE